MKPRVAVITGAAGGIGSVVGERFVREGYAVHCLDLHEDAAVQTASRIGAASGIGADVSKAAPWVNE